MVPVLPAEANYLTASTVAEARSLLGERGEEMDLLIVHPSVAYYLYQVGLLTFSTSALAASGAVTWGGGGVGVGAREVGEFAGCRVIVDSQVNINDPTTTGNRQEFRCYMMKSGTILEGVQQDLRIEADRNVLSKQDVLSVDYHSAYHVMGTKWSSASTTPPTQTCVPAATGLLPTTSTSSPWLRSSSTLLWITASSPDPDETNGPTIRWGLSFC